MGLSGTIPPDWNNVRKHIGPRFVSSEQWEDVIKTLKDLDAVRLQAATNANVDAEAAKADAVEHDKHPWEDLSTLKNETFFQSWF